LAGGFFCDVGKTATTGDGVVSASVGLGGEFSAGSVATHGEKWAERAPRRQNNCSEGIVGGWAEETFQQRQCCRLTRFGIESLCAVTNSHALVLGLGSVAQVLIGPNYPNAIGYTPLHGSYSALLQFGPSSTLGTPALIQTGLLPADARSITFSVSAAHNYARVTLDGVDIPLIAIGGGRLACDVTAFAGQQVQLEFSTTSYNGSWLYFDDIVFSPVAVPEPRILNLAVLGVVAVLLIGARRPKNRCRQRGMAGAVPPSRRTSSAPRA